jgi:hypothetical protein
MTPDYTKKTLGELLSALDKTIRDNALSILKRLYKLEKKSPCLNCNEDGRPRYARGSCGTCAGSGWL